MALLHHGTTRKRAERILDRGPDPDFVEPCGALKAESFSCCLASGPHSFGTPEGYARAKALLFPNEGGPVILVIDVPDGIVALTLDEVYFPQLQGLIQFDDGAGLEELQMAWPHLTKQIVAVD